MDLCFSHNYDDSNEEDQPILITYIYPVIEELIKEIIYDPRVGLGYCVQCGLEYPIKTGCTQTTCIYGKCHPKNFLPYVDKEGKKVFKGSIHFKKHNDWDPDEFVPHSPEIMEENRQYMRRRRAYLERRAKEYETHNDSDGAKHTRKRKPKLF